MELIQNTECPEVKITQIDYTDSVGYGVEMEVWGRSEIRLATQIRQPNGEFETETGNVQW